jgi:hypothetical protein
MSVALYHRIACEPQQESVADEQADRLQTVIAQRWPALTTCPITTQTEMDSRWPAWSGSGSTR